ncbi:MAG: hypothetical protein WC823_03660 [Parcubacteria group bacterium]|jgi:hypothetical protein
MKKLKNYQGSILITTIMVLSIILVTTLSIVFVSNIGRNMSTSSNNSLVAYQRADTGIEKTLAVIVDKYTNNSTATLAASIWHDSGVGECVTVGANKIIQKTNADGNFYTIQLVRRKLSDNTKFENVNCDASGVTFDKIVTIVAVGILPGKTQRAVSADVPPKPTL